MITMALPPSPASYFPSCHCKIAFPIRTLFAHTYIHPYMRRNQQDGSSYCRRSPECAPEPILLAAGRVNQRREHLTDGGSD